ncbi:hypothetical protein ACFQY9_18230 [Microvirga aerilata]|uniref:hypothetical protein n=1 Tax=Microvirga aerilata TaxID=670292 RepID=UPI00363C183C
MTQPTPSLDLTSCDREPIHVPGSIQPHGILLALDPETLSIYQAAGETEGTVGRAVDGLPGEYAEAVLGAQAVHLIRSAGVQSTEPLYLGNIPAPADPSRHLDVTAHRRDGIFILELEPSTPIPRLRPRRWPPCAGSAPSSMPRPTWPGSSRLPAGSSGASQASTG